MNILIFFTIYQVNFDLMRIYKSVKRLKHGLIRFNYDDGLKFKTSI